MFGSWSPFPRENPTGASQVQVSALALGSIPEVGDSTFPPTPVRAERGYEGAAGIMLPGASARGLLSANVPKNCLSPNLPLPERESFSAQIFRGCNLAAFENGSSQWLPVPRGWHRAVSNAFSTLGVGWEHFRA